MKQPRKWMLTVLLLYTVTLLDQWTKELVLRHMDYGARRVLVPAFLNLRHVRNTGAAWGLFADYQPVLIAVSVLMLGFLASYGRPLFKDLPGGSATLGLLAAGITGNLIDRLRLGYVVDFIDVHWRGRHFPSFNVADAAIFIGVVSYLVTHHFAMRRLAMRSETEPTTTPP